MSCNQFLTTLRGCSFGLYWHVTSTWWPYLGARLGSSSNLHVINTGQIIEFPVSEIVKDRVKSQLPFVYVQGIWVYRLPNLWWIGQISWSIMAHRKFHFWSSESETLVKWASEIAITQPHAAYCSLHSRIRQQMVPPSLPYYAKHEQPLSTSGGHHTHCFYPYHNWRTGPYWHR